VENRDESVVDGKQIAVVMERLRKAMRRRLDSGLLPYDGRWVTLTEMQQGMLDERKRARVHAIELVLLYGLFAIASFFIIALVVALCY
jgi:hypothetical protein